MIPADQATIFPAGFLVVTSSVKNGVIRHPSKDSRASHYIAAWCNQLGVPLKNTVGLYITYDDGKTYTDIAKVDALLCDAGAAAGEGWVRADALVTATPGVALILPVADCNAVVYVDPVHRVLALAHLGWHSTVNDLAGKVVRYMEQHYGTQPQDILIYNSPSIRKPSYIFNHLEQTLITRWHAEPYATRQPDGTYAIDLVRYNYDQWTQSGIQPKNIQIIPVDTAKSDDYPSHRMGEQSRFAVLAMIR